MDKTLLVRCPPMLVRNTGWWPGSVHVAQTLFCTGHVFGVPLITREQDENKAFRFPATPIRQVSMGLWMADPVLAFGYTVAGDFVQLAYGSEPIIRKSLRTMEAQSIPNILEASYIKINGDCFYLNAPLPTVLADAGWLLGLFSFTVRATEIKGVEV